MASPGLIVLISFSGAHGTGKTTLVNALRDALTTESGHEPKVHVPVVLPSVSTQWQHGEANRREAQGLKPLTCYDDIDKLGLRNRCQRELGVMLSMNVTDAITQVIGKGLGEGHVATIIADRWYPDIATYTDQTMPQNAANGKMAKTLNRILGEHQQTMMQRVTKRVGKAGLSFCFLNVAIPRMPEINGGADERAERATTDADEWEKLFWPHWERYTRQPDRYVVEVADLQQRVAGLRQRIQKLRP